MPIKLHSNILLETRILIQVHQIKMHTWDWEAAVEACRSGRVGAKGRRAAAGGGGVDTRGDEEVRVEKKEDCRKKKSNGTSI